jgi:hypothetical protein
MEKKLQSIQPPLDEAGQISTPELNLTDSTEVLESDMPVSRVYLSMGKLVVESPVRYSTSRGSYFDD